MALEPLDRSRLVLAYGRHWRRDEVRWSTGNQWQMLGRVGDRRPGLRLCDFGWARGVYVLELRKKPVYVGIARGRMGFAERLVKHHVENKKQWTPDRPVGDTKLRGQLLGLTTSGTSRG